MALFLAMNPQTFRPHAEGIHMKLPHLPREKLVGKLYEMVMKNNFVILSASSGLGRTALLTLFDHRHPEFHYSVSRFTFNSNPTDVLAKIGVDVVQKKCHLPFDGKMHVLMLEGCQQQYGNAAFWKLLMDSTEWIPAHVRFILSTTHMPEVDASANFVEFSNVPCKLERPDFLLNDEETRLLFTLANGLPSEMRFPTLVEVIIRECNGLVRALRISMDALYEFACGQQTMPTEKELLDYYFLREVVDLMKHCFGSRHTIPIGGELQSFLIKCSFRDVTPCQLPWTLFSDDEKQSFTMLLRAGIVIRDGDNAARFSSPLAARYSSKWLLPTRGAENPKSLHELIKKVIGSLSASSLKASITSEADFKVDAFQHHFMTALALHTHPTSCMCSELAEAFPDFPSEVDKQTNEGVDFYLAGSLGWGIELHVNGDDLDEHTARFAPGGKYAALAAKEYVVVDLRCNKEGKPRPGFCKQEKTTVFFELGDFSSAECRFGTNDTPNDQINK